jgi:hypothetical protein
MKAVATILLIAAMAVCAQAQNRSAGKVRKGNGVPNWDVSPSCRAAAKVAYTQDASAREKSCIEGENRTRDRPLARNAETLCKIHEREFSRAQLDVLLPQSAGQQLEK